MCSWPRIPRQLEERFDSRTQLARSSCTTVPLGVPQVSSPSDRERGCRQSRAKGANAPWTDCFPIELFAGEWEKRVASSSPVGSPSISPQGAFRHSCGPRLLDQLMWSCRGTAGRLGRLGRVKMYANALFQLIMPLAARPRHRAAPVRQHQVNQWSAPVTNLALAETGLLYGFHLRTCEKCPPFRERRLKVVPALTSGDTLMRSAMWCSVAIAMAAGACAIGSDKIAASYVSPLQYDSLTCPQVAGRASEG